MSTHRIDLPFTDPPLTLTDQAPHRADELRATVTAAAAGIDTIGPSTMQLHWDTTTSGVRDVISMRITSNVCADGIRDAGIATTVTPPQIRAFAPRPAMWIELIEDDADG